MTVKKSRVRECTWRRALVGATLGLCLSASQACRRSEQPAATPPAPAAPSLKPSLKPAQPPAPVAPALIDPVPLWEHGRSVRDVDAATAREDGHWVIDLGEAWTPYLFTDGPAPDGSWLINRYRSTYLALARGEFPDDLQGERARRDKYLELYGIAPTLAVLRERMSETASLDCAGELDLAPLQEFTGVVTYRNNQVAAREAASFEAAKARTLALMRAQHVADPDAIDVSALSRLDVGLLKQYTEQLPRFAAMDALQKRLRCEGILVGRGPYTPGVMDWATHESLAEFERRHRIFSQGYLARESRAALAQPPMELERAAVLRVLKERAMHAAAVLEDGSVDAVYRGRDGAEHEVPNLAARIERVLVEAFGLQTPDGALRFLNQLGELPAGQHRYVAIRMVPLPEYYAEPMELTLDYDRGDVWYDFPYDAQGKPVPQPVKHRPQVTVSTVYDGQKIPLARYGTTIGGWRTELIDGAVMWKYKDSAVGPRVWEEIVAAPVWLPPEGTPPEDLLKRNPQREQPSDPEYVLNDHEVGPSYASAYGLVAAYHKTYLAHADGRIQLGRDEGIRTHGSVDYMSIMRRHSHGCHRLHNHIALRLMSFVLAHQAHQRVGQRVVGFRRELVYKDETYLLDIPQTGYTFRLDKPLRVNVEEGNIMGRVKAPIPFAIPQYDAEQQAYVMADGSTVRVQDDQLIPLTPPPPAAPSGAPSEGTQPRASQAGAVGPEPGAAPSARAPREPVGRALAAARVPAAH